jgi:hypothetical protein
MSGCIDDVRLGDGAGMELTSIRKVGILERELEIEMRRARVMTCYGGDRNREASWQPSRRAM